MSIVKKFNRNILIALVTFSIHNFHQRINNEDYDGTSLFILTLLLINLIAFVISSAEVISLLLDLVRFQINKMELEQQTNPITEPEEETKETSNKVNYKGDISKLRSNEVVLEINPRILDLFKVTELFAKYGMKAYSNKGQEIDFNDLWSKGKIVKLYSPIRISNSWFETTLSLYDYMPVVSIEQLEQILERENQEEKTLNFC